ncbi:MAG: hypothetical protein MJ201_02375 [Mycoplasmoidaceae bacterium]|nr:hypothetical protein [Mycoplasmoidaceae bacterium]
MPTKKIIRKNTGAATDAAILVISGLPGINDCINGANKLTIPPDVNLHTSIPIT